MKKGNSYFAKKKQKQNKKLNCNQNYYATYRSIFISTSASKKLKEN